MGNAANEGLSGYSILLLAMAFLVTKGYEVPSLDPGSAAAPGTQDAAAAGPSGSPAAPASSTAADEELFQGFCVWFTSIDWVKEWAASLTEVHSCAPNPTALPALQLAMTTLASQAGYASAWSCSHLQQGPSGFVKVSAILTSHQLASLLFLHGMRGACLLHVQRGVWWACTC